MSKGELSPIGTVRLHKRSYSSTGVAALVQLCHCKMASVDISLEEQGGALESISNLIYSTLKKTQKSRLFLSKSALVPYD